MHDWIEKRVKDSRLEYLVFFRRAYFWNFEKIYEPRDDVLNYKASGVIPLYLAKYVRYLQTLEGKRRDMS